VEGAAEDVQEYVGRLRALQWKAMQVSEWHALMSGKELKCAGVNSGPLKAVWPGTYNSVADILLSHVAFCSYCSALLETLVSTSFSVL
jgi:hypothetical protein